MRWTLWPLLMLTSISLGGCGATTDSFCDVAAAIRPSPRDVLTDGTRQILAHDQIGAKLCGWK